LSKRLGGAGQARGEAPQRTHAPSTTLGYAVVLRTGQLDVAHTSMALSIQRRTP
jgi:hypothetical protein